MFKHKSQRRVSKEEVLDLLRTRTMLEYHNMEIELVKRRVINCYWDLEFDLEDAAMAGDLKSYDEAYELRRLLHTQYYTEWYDWLRERFHHGW